MAIKTCALALALISRGHASTITDANIIITQMSNAVHFKNEDPENILYEYGLESDYVFDILFFER